MTISPTPTLSLDDFWAIVETQSEGPDDIYQAQYVAKVGELLGRVAARADFICVYRNEDFGSPDLGLLQITTYGSPASQIEESQFPDGPPIRLPDIGGAINWRYQLVGILAPGANA